MKKHGTVRYNGKLYYYEVDEYNYVWIIEGRSKTNIGQRRPLIPSDDVEQAVLEMLAAGGY